MSREPLALNWRRGCGAAALIASYLLMLIGCGASTHSILISPSAVVLLPGQTFQFNIARIGDSASSTQPPPVLLVNGVVGGSSSTGTITPGGLYTAPSTVSGQQITVGIQGQSSSAAVTVFDPAKFTSGSIRATQNPLVALYSVLVPADASVEVQFGLDPSYGFSTSGIQTPTGGEVTVLVAGMRAATTYHMQAVVDLPDGSRVLDTDHIFTTGSVPAARLPNMTTQLTGVGTPSDGIELFSLSPRSAGTLLSTVATDLAGNVIWYYDLEPADAPFPIKPLPNGHMLVLVTQTGFSSGGVNEIREID